VAKRFKKTKTGDPAGLAKALLGEEYDDKFADQSIDNLLEIAEKQNCLLHLDWRGVEIPLVEAFVNSRLTAFGAPKLSAKSLKERLAKIDFKKLKPGQFGPKLFSIVDKLLRVDGHVLGNVYDGSDSFLLFVTTKPLFREIKDVEFPVGEDDSILVHASN
jgi:hypothetical protein